MKKSTPKTAPEPRFFATPAAWRAWLAKNHAKESELVVGLFKTHVAHKGVTYQQALDEALCWGWIDGVSKSIDEERWKIRFTPRKKNSYWSAKNLKRARELIAEGRMAPPGEAAFDARTDDAGTRYSFENEHRALTADEERLLRANAKARAFWDAQPPYYKKTATFWVASAKKPETRAKRLRELIDDAANGLRIKVLRPRIAEHVKKKKKKKKKSP